MKTKRTFLLLLLCCAAQFFTASAQTVLLAGDYPDPTVIKDGDDYYMTHSPLYCQPGFLIWHSRDLFNWEPICRVVDEWRGSAWAPELQKVDDTYYIYFPSDDTNWVTTAKNIRGPWTKPIDLKIGGIDPGLVISPEGKRYLYTNGGQVTPLTDDGLARAGQTQDVYDGWKYPNEWVTECMCLESPKLNYHNGYYYMTSAQGGTAGPPTSHMAVCARSRNVLGPWENSPYNPIVHTYSASERWWSKGHGTIIEGPDGQWWIIYHAYENGAYSLGRYTLMEPIEWTKGGWYRLVKDLDITKRAGGNPDPSDNFTLPAIGWQWSAWKENLTKVASIKKGAFCIPGKGTSPKDGRLALITASDKRYAVQVDVATDKKNATSGLLLFYSEKTHAGLMADAKQLTLYTNGDNTETFPNKYGKELTIRLENLSGKLNVLVCGKDGVWETLRAGIDISGFHHNKLGSFFALRPALCSVGQGDAEFRTFRYFKNPESLVKE